MQLVMASIVQNPERTLRVRAAEVAPALRALEPVAA